MKERPINLKAHEVLAILDGRKTQTRRVVFNKRTTDFQSIEERDDGSLWPWRETDDAQDHWYPCPYGQPGDRLWVRENFDFLPAGGPDEPQACEIVYWATGSLEPRECPHDYNPMIYGREKIRPSIHMPRWASRITLEITSVRVERLRDIREADAIAEGSYLDRCACLPRSKDRTPMHDAFKLQTCHIHGSEFSYLWESINGNGSWDKNPWVWVVEFRRINKKGGAA